MHDRFDYINPITDSGENIGSNESSGTEITEIPDTESEEIFDTVSDTVFDPVGSDSDSATDTEVVPEDITSNEVDNTDSGTENGVDNQTSYEESSSVDYVSEFEYIDYLLNTQIDEMNAVQSVSGNSVVISIDETGMQTLAEIKQNQQIQIENQGVLINLCTCLLLVVVIDFLFASAKRIMKKMSFRKE